MNVSHKALLGKLDLKEKTAPVTAEHAWVKFQDANDKFEGAVYGAEIVANLQVTQSEAFNLCERAHALDKYLTVANDQ